MKLVINKGVREELKAMFDATERWCELGRRINSAPDVGSGRVTVDLLDEYQEARRLISNHACRMIAHATKGERFSHMVGDRYGGVS